MLVLVHRLCDFRLLLSHCRQAIAYCSRASHCPVNDLVGQTGFIIVIIIIIIIIVIIIVIIVIIIII